MSYNLAPGNVFPDYQLPDHTGTPRRLSELQGDDPLILTLARGHYCAKELGTAFCRRPLARRALYSAVDVTLRRVRTVGHTQRASWPYKTPPSPY